MAIFRPDLYRSISVINNNPQGEAAGIKAYHFQLLLLKKTFFEVSSHPLLQIDEIFLISNPFHKDLTRRAAATNEKIEFIGTNVSNLNLRKLDFQL